jgi:exodeoxyribonuclease VII large subunit
MNPSAFGQSQQPSYQVSELTEILRSLLEDSLPSVWVEGEVSNFSRPASGHWYFTLKDSRSQLRCAMFKNRNYYVRPQPRDGDTVRVRATVSLYGGRGDLQLICEAMEAAGSGALLAALERLKQKLQHEGLFVAERKRPLPTMPRHIGLITSGTGAALHDIQATLQRRFPLVRVSLWPVPVQGTEAAPAIAKALKRLPQAANVEAILLARGGGSLEDLWAFNEEIVVRAVAACTVPVVTGIGHEIDFTLADFAADHRAATPTAAAEALVPDHQALIRHLQQQQASLQQQTLARLRLAQRNLHSSLQRLAHQSPQRRLHEQAQRLDDLSQRLLLATQRRRQALAQQLAALAPRLGTGVQGSVQGGRARHAALSAALAALNPRAVLQRGYAIALDADGKSVRDAAQLSLGASVHLQFAVGAADARIERVMPQ